MALTSLQKAAATAGQVLSQIFHINIYVAAGINCSRALSGSLCEPGEVLPLAIELCHQPRTPSLGGEGGKGKRKKGKASGQTIDYSSELQGAIDFSLNTMYCCKAEKK